MIKDYTCIIYILLPKTTMKLLKTIKDFFTGPTLLTQFLLEKKYRKTKKTITWWLKIVPKEDITVTKVTFKMQETIRKPKLPDQKKREEIQSEIGDVTVPGPREIEGLKEQRVEFSLPINISKQKKIEKKVYKWDMALMNKAHDEAKSTVFIYKIFAYIKIQWVKRPFKVSHSIVIE